jgi:hypothetical protein
MKRWLVGSALFGLLAPLVVLILIRAHVKLLPVVAFSVWPTMLVIAKGAFGMSGRVLIAYSVLLNALLYAVLGYVTGLVSQKCRGIKRA